MQSTKQAAPAQEKIKPSSSFRLKKEFAATATHYEAASIEAIAEKQEKAIARETFDQNQVLHALRGYIKTHKPETAVAMALTTHKPEVKGEKVIVEVDNHLQMTKLNDIKSGLQNHLADKLKNGFIELSFHIFDNSNGKEEKKLFTSHDKFEHFMQVNPAVAELKAIFGLELE